MSETSAAENSRCELCGQPAPNVDLRLDARGNGSALKALICSDCALDLELWMDEDTAERSVGELKEQLQENARKIAEGETVTLEEALDNRTENPDELLDADDLDVDASDVEISFPEDGLEPAAWGEIREDGTCVHAMATWNAITESWVTQEKFATIRSTPEEYVEPLVRPDQLFDRLMRIVEEHRHRAEDASAAGNEKERYACESVADVIYDAVMEWKLQIKEFTQGEPSA